jgi:putative DNA methylase
VSGERALLALISGLAKAHGVELSPREIAELLWLRGRMGQQPKKTSKVKLQRLAEPLPRLDHQEQEALSGDANGSESNAAEEFPRNAEPKAVDVSIEPGGHDVPIPELPALDDELGHARALHRLAAKRCSPHLRLIDIERVVEHIAATTFPLLAFRPVERRVTRLVLVIDRAGQLAPYARAFERLGTLARQISSFSSVETWWIDLADAAEARLYKEEHGVELLHDEVPARGGPDQLLLVLSDAVAPAVSSGALGRLFRKMPRGTRVGWLHPWEPALWDRTQVERLRPARPTYLPGADAKVPITVAMVPLSIDGLRLLEPWIQGRASRGLQGWTIPSGPRRSAARPLTSTPPEGWSERARRIFGVISPEARQILALAAVIPSHLDVELLHALCHWFDISNSREWRQSIAEAMSAGLLERVPGSSGGKAILLRFPSDEVRRAALAYAERNLVMAVLQRVVERFASPEPEIRRAAKRLQLPISLLVRLVTAPDSELPPDVDTATPEATAALMTVLQGTFGAEASAILAAVQAREPGAGVQVEQKANVDTGLAYRKKLIEVALPLEAINAASMREKAIRHGHPSTLHLWWARRPLAAARAVLFGQLVDDPSAWPEIFPTEKAQANERSRLFQIIEELVTWENSNKEVVINAARFEIARSHARTSGSLKAKSILAQSPSPAVVNDYICTEMPPVHDPFAGGGSIPLEAQRLGLRAIASDLNPVAVIINKSLIEIPSKFARRPPVNPEARRAAGLHTWKGAQGLADDVRYYGDWMRAEAWKRIGHLYPEVTLPKHQGGGQATVIAWIWARTVPSPNPVVGGVPVPLISSFWLSRTKARQVWVEAVISEDRKSYSLEVNEGVPTDTDAIELGTKLGRGANFRCILSGVPIEPDYIKAEGIAKRLGIRLVAVVADGKHGRIYLSPATEVEKAARAVVPSWIPDGELPANRQYSNPPAYGLKTFGDLFTDRQLVALNTFSELVDEARARISADAQQGGESDALSYGDACAVYLALVVSSLADRMSTLCTWDSGGATWGTKTRATFARQAFPITWDFAEVNPFSGQSGSFENSLDYTTKPIAELGLVATRADMTAVQMDAAAPRSTGERAIISTDPPYYDNVPYADLSDFFYIWLRRSLRTAYPTLFSTVLVPKADELVANVTRHGGREEAQAFFLAGMTRALTAICNESSDGFPTAIYYAFKQSELDSAGISSTGWETFLNALVTAGFSIVGTWPVRTELSTRMRSHGSNALASSVVLVCRPRHEAATSLTRGQFRRALRDELPTALRALKQGNIAPVDVAQASIGPGMAIFSRHAKVLEADGSTMTVRSALQLINEVLFEYLTEQQGDVDADTHFAITWYETNGWNAGSFGDAETLARARNLSVDGVVTAGILRSAAGKVSLLRRADLPENWDPAKDTRLTVWEATQHLIKRLDKGEAAAAKLLKQLGPIADSARDLAYRLYNTCERRKWAEDALAYNGLVVAWPELEKLAQSMSAAPVQADRVLIDVGAPTAPTGKGAPRRGRKRS